MNLKEKIKGLEKRVETLERDRLDVWKFIHDLSEVKKPK